MQQAWTKTLIFLLFAASCFSLFAPQLWTFQYPQMIITKVQNKNMIGPRNLVLMPLNHFNIFFSIFLKLLRSPGRDCPRFKALMTETFESRPYQSFLQNHQVRQITEEDGLFSQQVRCLLTTGILFLKQSHWWWKKIRWLCLVSGLFNLDFV